MAGTPDPQAKRDRNDPAAMIGPYTRPLRHDPAVWITVALVLVATAFNALRGWTESSNLGNVLVIGGYTFVLSSIATLFTTAVIVGIPRGWRLGRQRHE